MNKEFSDIEGLDKYKKYKIYFPYNNIDIVISQYDWIY